MESVIPDRVPVAGFVVVCSDSALDLPFRATAPRFPRAPRAGQGFLPAHAEIRELNCYGAT